METIQEQNKKTIIRFNIECIESGNQTTFDELLADGVLNHSAPADSSKGKLSFTNSKWERLFKRKPKTLCL